MRVDRSLVPVKAGLQAAEQISTADAVLMLFTFLGGLLLDRTLELPAQTAGSVLVWAVMLRALHRAHGDLRVIIIACLAWSSLGEVIGSLIWGLYKYRLYNIPMFVPPGHVLMLLVALYVAQHMRAIVLAVAPATAVGYAAYAHFSGSDIFSVAITPLFFVALLLGRNRQVYAATFLLAIGLELYGTWLGNWRWELRAPGLDLTMANPPLCIGALYCLRDALAGRSTEWLRSLRHAVREPDVLQQPAALSAPTA
jgi:hypothetical protein